MAVFIPVRLPSFFSELLNDLFFFIIYDSIIVQDQGVEKKKEKRTTHDLSSFSFSILQARGGIIKKSCCIVVNVSINNQYDI